MFKPWPLTILIAVALICLGFFISLFGVRNRLDAQVFGGKFLEIRDSVETTFIPKHDFLNIIILAFKNPSLDNKGNFKFRIFDENGTVLREVDFSGRNIGDPSNVRVQFEPLPRSAGKNLTLHVERTTADQPLVSIATGDKDEVAFASYYRTINKRQTGEDILSYWRGILVNNLFFFGPWAILLSVILVWSRRTG